MFRRKSVTILRLLLAINRDDCSFLRLLLAINRDDCTFLRLLLAINRDDLNTFCSNALPRITTPGLQRQSGRKSTLDKSFVLILRRFLDMNHALINVLYKSFFILVHYEVQSRKDGDITIGILCFFFFEKFQYNHG